MGWSIGSDGDRDIGYGVPAECDYPDCSKRIDRGLSYVCGSDPYGGAWGCGLYFCSDHLETKEVKNLRTIQVPGEEFICVSLCERCYENKASFEPKPDIPEWVNHKLTDESWQEWRDENPSEVQEMLTQLNPNQPEFKYFWRVKNRFPERFGEHCAVLVRGEQNNCLVQFKSDNFKTVTSRNYMRKIKEMNK